MMRRVAYGLGLVVLLASGTYVFVYLYRWEWNRALFAAALFIATEVAMGLAWVLERLRGLADAVDRLQRADPEVQERLRESRPPGRRHFAWLAPNAERMDVFVPILMGAGVVLSALAWAVEKLARATARPTLERALAARLRTMSLPEGGLVPARAGEPVVVDLR
ncbi:MAG TPA: hypothetical protein VHF47_01395 [Acidimicrobiales bacterium]|nr:hypothetical protein [Acidimicrobiales bacterium]